MNDLVGKTMVVTGATSGIGLEAAVMLAARGATVVLVGRDAARTQAAVATVKSRSGATAVSSLLCDFGDRAQIRRLASELLAQCPRIDVLINNAGSVSATREVTPDGYEKTFAVNHLGYFLLTTLLLERLKASAPARIVSVASIGHRNGTLDWGDLHFANGGYSTMKAYSRSKLGNVLFTRELARRLEGTGVTTNCLHPGGVATNIWSHAPGWTKPLLAVLKLFMVSPKQGGDVLVHLATAPELANVSGHYFERFKDVEPSELARDAAAATKLWAVSEQLVDA